jgi:DNA-binding transcriptional ArsR family regulator
MNSAAQQVSVDDVAGALSDGTRRSILRLVRDDERSAGDIAGQFGEISRPAVSQHLRVLQDAGLVTVRPDGNRRMYRARREGLTAMWQFLDEMWTDRLGQLKVAAERAERTERQRARRGSKSRQRLPPDAARTTSTLNGARSIDD